MVLTQSQIERIIERIREAGDHLAGLSHGEMGWTQKDDGTWVSTAEPPLEESLRDFLLAEFPGANFVGEETSGEDELKEGKVNIVLDPLDGSSVKRRELACWGVSLAILDETLYPALSVLYFPVLGRWFVSAAQQGCLVPFVVESKGGKVNLTQAAPCSGYIAKALEKLSDKYVWVNSNPHAVLDLRSLKCKVRSFGTTSLHLALLTEDAGDPLAAALHRYKLYDIAGPLGVTESHGCEILDLKENKIVGLQALLKYPRKEIDNRPLLVAQPNVLEAIRDQVRLKPTRLVATDATNTLAYPAGFALVHKLGVWHRVVHVEICNKDGAFLVWKRGDGRFEIPGGHVDWLDKLDRAESYWEAALRELVEELNLEENCKVSKLSEKQWLTEAKERLVPLTVVRNELHSSHGDNHEFVQICRLEWDDNWGDPTEDWRVGDDLTTSAKWLLGTDISKEWSRGTKMNAALRLIIERLPS